MRKALIGLSAMILAACGGGGATDMPDRDLLLGDWVQTQTTAASGRAMRDARVSYAKDGTSEFNAVLVLDDPALPETARDYRMRADVRWDLTESVLVRTLQTVELQPVTATEQSERLADLYEDGLRQAAQATYLIESLSAEQLVLLSPEDGTRQTYTRP